MTYSLGPHHSLKSLKYLDLDLRLGDIPLAPGAICDLVCLDQLGADGFSTKVFERVGLDRVDAQLGVGLNDGETTGDWIGSVGVHREGCIFHWCSGDGGRTEEGLATSALLDDLHDAGLQLLDGRYVVGKNTHDAGFSGNVDLDAVCVETC